MTYSIYTPHVTTSDCHQRAGELVCNCLAKIGRVYLNPYGEFGCNKIGNDMFPVDIETLTQERQTNFTVIRTLDQKTEDIKTEIDRCLQMYGQEVGRMSAIQEMFKKAIENSDNKVQMATADV